jgi:hypothetical protein
MAVDDLGEDIGQIGLGIDGIHFAGCDQRGQDCPMFATAIGAGEEMILAPERNGTDGALTWTLFFAGSFAAVVFATLRILGGPWRYPPDAPIIGQMASSLERSKSTFRPSI